MLVDRRHPLAEDFKLRIVLTGQLPQQLAAIEAALAAGAVAAVGGVAHSLKSASYSIGAKRLGDLCAAIEAAARGGDAAAVGDGCGGLAGAWALLQPEIEGHLAS